jgi:hypothetical protein
MDRFTLLKVRMDLFPLLKDKQDTAKVWPYGTSYNLMLSAITTAICEKLLLALDNIIKHRPFFFLQLISLK